MSIQSDQTEPNLVRWPNFVIETEPNDPKTESNWTTINMNVELGLSIAQPKSKPNQFKTKPNCHPSLLSPTMSSFWDKLWHAINVFYWANHFQTASHHQVIYLFIYFPTYHQIILKILIWSNDFIIHWAISERKNNTLLHVSCFGLILETVPWFSSGSISAKSCQMCAVRKPTCYQNSDNFLYGHLILETKRFIKIQTIWTPKFAVNHPPNTQRYI